MNTISHIAQQFKPFDLVENCNDNSNDNIIITKPCPDCGQPIVSQNRRGYSTWTCWRCVSKLLTVTRILSAGYGFGDDEDGNAIYFHFTKQARVYYEGGDYPTINTNTCSDNIFTIPKINDILRYQEIVGKTPKALWWMFEIEYENVIAAINNRPMYRLVEKDDNHNHIVWQGRDVNELIRKFPVCDYPVLDESRFFVKKETHNNLWIACTDPRTSGWADPRIRE